MNERVLWAGGHGATLLLLLAGISFVSGYWAVLLALGPAAYLPVLDAHNPDNTPQMVVIGYIAALAVGWTTHSVVARGIAPMAIEPMSEPGLRIVGSALIAFAITTAILYGLETYQPMAYVAAFTAAIGGFATLQSLVVAVAAVLMLGVIQAIRRRYGPEFATPSELTSEQSSGF